MLSKIKPVNLEAMFARYASGELDRRFTELEGGLALPPLFRPAERKHCALQSS